MIELKGEYNTAKIFTDVVDQKSISQVTDLLNQKFVIGSRIRMMPDIHAGAGCTIGTTMTIVDKIVPNLVGVDIGCGMLCVQLQEKEIDLQKLDTVIRENIPSGLNIRNDIHRYYGDTLLNKLDCYEAVDINRAARSIGTLGGGNHFIEVDRDDNGYLYLVIHTGSRHLGVEVANFYQEQAYNYLKYSWKKERNMLIKSLKANGREKEISTELTKHTFDITKDFAYLHGSLFNSYIRDMKIVQNYAAWNRRTIADIIIKNMNLVKSQVFETIHNYIDTENMIMRKGAVSAQAGEKLLIPINMRDGSLICIGKGNPDWNYSAPHGAGRLMSRHEAKNKFSVDEFAKSMEGIYTTSVGSEILDECPMAYKSIDDIVNNICDTVDILKVIKPIYNFKASE